MIPAISPARFPHPLAWGVALALHLGLAALLPRPAPESPVAAGGLTLGLSGAAMGGAAESLTSDGMPGDLAAIPVGPNLAESGDSPAELPQVAPPSALLPPPPSPRAPPPPDLVQATPPPPATPPVQRPAPRRAATSGTATRPAGPTPGSAAGEGEAASGAATAAGAGQSAALPGEAAGARPLPPAYAAALVRLLQRNLRYPQSARDQGREGTATLRFTIARDGTVLATQLVRGSGSPLLDAEALALLRRVSPLPRLPDEFPDPQAMVVVPIGFALR